jgi:DNA-binding YbaB/EbfC family protein
MAPPTQPSGDAPSPGDADDGTIEDVHVLPEHPVLPEIVDHPGASGPADMLTELLGGGAPGGGLDLSSLLDSAQQLMQAQQEAAGNEVVGTAGGGKVEVTVTGSGEFRQVRINPDVVDPDDVGMLEDLVLAALRDAMAKVNAAQTAAFGGFDLGDLGGLGGLLGDR